MDFVGRFHPLFVHLPIGVLLIVVLFIWLNESKRVIKISLAVGALTAVASVITGLLLAQSEGYSSEVNTHKWSGIVLMIVSVAMFFVPERFLKPGSIVMVIMVFVTGHLGGTLTHGSLIAEPEADNLDVSKIDFTNAIFYDDAVKPVLEARCYSCHGDTKQKGGLRLDSEDLIMKGGKNGKVIIAGNPEESELLKRILLPIDDEDHMPPKEKKQLTEEEKKLISMWIESGPDFKKKISESLDEKKIKELSHKSESLEMPDIDVPTPDEKLLEKLTEQSVAITPVAKGSNLLQANFISVPNEAQALLETLKPVAKNIVILKLSKTNVISLGDYENLISLNLSDTNVGDDIIDRIITYKNLVSLNLSGTKITSVEKLKSLEKLRYLNIYNTPIKEVNLPNVKIERGNYSVPALETDTIVVRVN
ncbi:MAG: c-type cytochrome domain-containing protein [Bacteroidota bacterium]